VLLSIRAKTTQVSVGRGLLCLGELLCQYLVDSLTAVVGDLQQRDSLIRELAAAVIIECCASGLGRGAGGESNESSCGDLKAAVAVVDAEEVRGEAEGGSVEAVDGGVAGEHPERDVEEAWLHVGGVLHLGSSAAHGLEPPARHAVEREDAPGGSGGGPGPGGGERGGGGGGGGGGDEVVEHERGAEVGESLEVGGGDAAAVAGDGAGAPGRGLGLGRGAGPRRLRRRHRGSGVVYEVSDGGEEREAPRGEVVHGLGQGREPLAAAAVVVALPSRDARRGVVVVMGLRGGVARARRQI